MHLSSTIDDSYYVYLLDLLDNLSLFYHRLIVGDVKKLDIYWSILTIKTSNSNSFCDYVHYNNLFPAHISPKSH